jgi:hypothetical protein
MIQSKIFKLENNVKRKKENFILIVPISNFINREIFIEPDMLTRNTYFSFPTIQNYFYERLSKKHLPFHFYADFIKNDWHLLIGSPLNYKSSWLDECISNYYIPSSFENATIICVQDSFDFEIPDSRMFKLIGKTITEPYLFQNKFQNINTGIFLFHEVFDFSKYEADKERFKFDFDFKYRVESAKFFDRTTFNLELAAML